MFWFYLQNGELLRFQREHFFYQQVVETVRYSPNSAVGKYKSVAHFVKHKTICETKVKAREMHNIVFNNNIDS